MAIMKVTGILMLIQASLLAHTVVGTTSGFDAGFFHPVSGADHMLAMVAVGLWAVQMGGKGLWAVPAAFIGMMFFGGIVGMSGMEMLFIEAGILASVVVLGGLVATGIRLPLTASAVLVGAFAVFHGYAHGAEMPLSAGGFAYSAGFVLATATLHGTGIAAGMALNKVYSARYTRIGGGTIAAAGVLLALA